MHSIIKKSYPIIEKWIPYGSSVLDLGCGDGRLLESLAEHKQVSGTGVEISEEKIIQCIKKGLTVFQSDIDQGLYDWEDNSFDYVILNATLQEITRPAVVIQEMLRVGKYAIISIYNFGYIINRLKIFFSGRISDDIRFEGDWYNSPVIRFVSLQEFYSILDAAEARVDDAKFLFPFGIVSGLSCMSVPGNLFSKEVIFRLKRGNNSHD